MTACRWLVDRPLNGDLTRRYDFETQRMGIEWTNHDWLMIDLWLWGGCYLTYGRVLEKKWWEPVSYKYRRCSSQYIRIPSNNLTCQYKNVFLEWCSSNHLSNIPRDGNFRCQVRLPEIKYRRATCGNGFGRWIQSWKHWNRPSMSCFEVRSSDSYPNST